MVRAPPELLRQLVIEAADQHMSLNRLIRGRLGV
ncbi:toxin-antitoxin system HicB family antitoxin [Propionicimonas paludicola]